MPASDEHKRERKRLLSQTRVKVALWIAVAEGIIAAIDRDISRWTIIIVAVPVILFYLLAGRSLESRLGYQASWVAATSQALAVVLVILTFVLKIFTLVIVGVFAGVALFLLFMDRPPARAE